MQRYLKMFAWEAAWLIPAFAVAVTQLSLAWWLHFKGFAAAPLLESYSGTSLLTLSVVIIGWLFWQLFKSWRANAESPIAFLQEATKPAMPSFIAALIGLQIIAMGSSGAGILKGAIPTVSPFWFDVPIAAFERSVFGADPWQISHQVLGWATPAIDVAYAAWLPIEMAALFFVLLSSAGREKAIALTSQSLLWLFLGCLVAHSLSSAGPIFYDRIYHVTRFPIDLSDAPIAAATSQKLWYSLAHNTPGIGTGISAAPSLHVAIAVWMAFVCRQTRLAVFAWIYAAVIFVGSIHLGWHYMFDGLFAIASVPIAWGVSAIIVDALYRRLSLIQPETGLRPPLGSR